LGTTIRRKSKGIGDMKVLVACEESGVVRNAFAARGHLAVSCDLLPTESTGIHYHGDILDIINLGWDLMIAHPPCTYITISANKWLKDQPPRKSGALVGEARRLAQRGAIDFFIKLYNAPIKKVAIENPIGVMSSIFRKPDQVIQPWMFGHGETKATCLWLKNLPKLVWARETNLFEQKTAVDGREQRIHKLAPSPDRAKIRSRTFSGIAKAMAEQWG
jgi:hypothetical protein